MPQHESRTRLKIVTFILRHPFLSNKQYIEQITRLKFSQNYFLVGELYFKTVSIVNELYFSLYSVEHPTAKMVDYMNCYCKSLM